MNRKELGQYMTPDWVVEKVLDAIGYSGDVCLGSVIMEPSFGDGQFLCEIARRIIESGRQAGIGETEISSLLDRLVLGIEKDPVMYDRALSRLGALLGENGIPAVEWKGLRCGDTLDLYREYTGCCSYVAGNPPYIPVAKLEPSVRVRLKQDPNLPCCRGTTDLYIAFYEIGLHMLDDTGALGFITPNTFMKNTSQKRFRRQLVEQGLISKLYDFKSSRIFPNADVYACICVLDRRARITLDVNWREYDSMEMLHEQNIPARKMQTLFPDGKPWLLGNREQMEFLEKMEGQSRHLGSLLRVQNGIATNRDRIYIHDVFDAEGVLVQHSFEGMDEVVYLDRPPGQGGVPIESGILRRCIKGSRCDRERPFRGIIFPYDSTTENMADGKTQVEIMKEDVLQQKYPLAYVYLNAHREELEKRDLDTGTVWYEFGRSQGLQTAGRPKLVFKHILDRQRPIMAARRLEPDVLVYSGIFGVAVSEHEGKALDRAMEAVCHPDCAKWLAIAGKDLSGGYASVSARLLEKCPLADVQKESDEENEKSE